MDVKYGKKSGMTLEQLAALYDAEMKKREEERERAKYERMESDGYFHTAQEMIDYVLNGGKIVEDMDDEWMKLVDGKIINHRMFCNDIDMPIGMGDVSLTIDEFKEWVNSCEVLQQRDNKPFVNDYFHKDYEADEL